MVRNTRYRILFTGGGTGGHIYPLIAVSAELQMVAAQSGLDLHLRYLGSAGSYRQLLQDNGIKVGKIWSSKLRRYFSFKNFIDFPKFGLSLVQALWKVFWQMPDVVFSKGGPSALAVVLAARFYRIPVVIHDSDAIPGLTNLITGRYARVITTSFPGAKDYFRKTKAEIINVGNPVRRYLLSEEISQTWAKSFLGFDPNQPLILVLGGSQGSERINNFIVGILPSLLPLSQVLHQTGRGNYDRVVQAFQIASADISEELKRKYQVVDYFEKDMRIALGAADLVVSRAGSGSIFEIAAFGRPSILIPLPEAANGHQSENAAEYSKTGAAEVIEESNLLPHLFLNQITGLFNDPNELTKMSQAAFAFYKPDAAVNIAQIILQVNAS
ncbi:MAG: UDP-N-acetylglucosamine--N-acetylmuramyl-(pentapeptide) pyrophosphoryl-undecaprenol N-acetylglucosamine transferase [Candidatus Colwellbacteria bacterium]|nr:UDP-N-acetylglucosamine--N-acetylmuramyl-(pentapeptide) pyrophosphoryl-undecaprenol N-acetylglucosamine transferase [Candidatus Colwellbacteria bacterium]